MNTSLHTRISRKADIRSGSGCEWERGRGLRKAGARARRYTGLLVQERSGANTPRVSYTRGRDLSGGLEGAGGIGGLLARSHGYSGGNWSSHNFYHADGNGNVTALVNSSGTLQASYKYDPYGRLRSLTGALSNANRLRWSSKPWEGYGPSGVYSYGYRFYDPYLQRWLNRDPIEEEGGLNLYAYVDNDPANGFDQLGLFAGAPLPAPPPTLPLPPILTPKPGPPPVVACTVTFCCFYEGTAYVCEKTGFHDWLGTKLCPVKEKKYKIEKCAKVRDWIDPKTGRRFCKFRCEYTEEIIRRKGDECNKDRIFRVVEDN